MSYIHIDEISKFHTRHSKQVIAGIMRKEINRSLERKGVDRQYVVNITQLHEIIHDVNILFSMINGKKRR